MTSTLEPAIRHRTVVVGLVWNRDGKLLVCKMPENRGVFPGAWGFAGGGIEPGERMVAALQRELREELGIEIEDPQPAFFKDCLHSKTLPDGSQQMIYMIFLVFHCRAESTEIRLNDEFSEFRWVTESEAQELDLNSETLDTLSRIGPWSDLDFSV